MARGLSSLMRVSGVGVALGDKGNLAAACAAFARDRNRSKSGVNSRFTTANARVKLKGCIRQSKCGNH